MKAEDSDSKRLEDYVAGRLLTRQKALVTGADSGIGRAVAIALADAGAYFRDVAQSGIMLDLLTNWKNFSNVRLLS